MNKRILVLGGGINQLALIKAAKEMGYYVIVCDSNDCAIGKQYADSFHLVSIKDRDTIIEIAKKEGINGIVANTEYIMSEVAFISEKLNLIGNNHKSIDIILSKEKFRKMQSQCGVFTPRHFELDSFKKIENLKDKIEFPIIIKPSESSGTRGTTKVENFEKLMKTKEVFDTCKKVSRNGLVTIEEFIEMESLQVIEGEIFIHQGEILWDGLFTTYRSKEMPMVPMTYVFPVQTTTERIECIKKNLSKLIKHIGIKHGEYNVEMYFSKNNELFVIEINARQGGNFLPQYVCRHNGIDLNKLLVSTAVGDNKYWSKIKRRKKEVNFLIHHILFAHRSGTFLELRISDDIKENVVEVNLQLKEGDNVSKSVDSTSKIGYVDLEFETEEEMIKIAKNIEKYININVKERDE